MTDLTARITQLRHERAFHHKLGRRKKVVQIDAVLQPLVKEQLDQENLAATIRRDIEIIVGTPQEKRRRVA